MEPYPVTVVEVQVESRVTDAALAGVVGFATLVDYLLLRRGHRLLSTRVRDSLALRVAWAALTAHLLFRLKYDPLTWAATRVKPREERRVHHDADGADEVRRGRRRGRGAR